MNNVAIVLEKLVNDAKIRERSHLEYVDKLGARDKFLSTTSNTLFALAVALVFPAVFTTSPLGLVPLIFGIAGCCIVYYRSRADLLPQLEMNMWFASRLWSFYDKCLHYQHASKVGSPFDTDTQLSLFQEEYYKVVEDINAWSAGQQTDLMLKFEEERQERQRRSAAIGNKYNKHEIKQFM